MEPVFPIPAEALQERPAPDNQHPQVNGFCSNFCRGLYFMFMLIFFGTGIAVFVLSAYMTSAPSQIFMGAVLFALGGCCGFVFINWPSIVQSTRLCCCCIYSISVGFCASLLGAGCLLAERSPKYLREDGLVLLGLGLLGFLFVGLYALSARKSHPGSLEEGIPLEERVPVRVSFLDQLSRTRMNSNSAMELCKNIFTDTIKGDHRGAFAPHRLQELPALPTSPSAKTDKLNPNDPPKVVILCIVQSDSSGAGPSSAGVSTTTTKHSIGGKTVHFSDVQAYDNPTPVSDIPEVQRLLENASGLQSSLSDAMQAIRSRPTSPSSPGGLTGIQIQCDGQTLAGYGNGSHTFVCVVPPATKQDSSDKSGTPSRSVSPTQPLASQDGANPDTPSVVVSDAAACNGPESVQVT